LEGSLEAPDKVAATAQVDEMCGKLLANPVIEVYRFDLEPLRSPSRAAP
ncbi:MAG: phosphoribosylformylglycinamidine synthase subunit PurS, partial [Chloroflexi bacterium]|nr:phosphoribosylformylglycinamidine synthase subunit PurS [Chloroflexota bacterium]